MTASIRGGIFTMAMLLKGAEVAKALTEELHAKTEELKKNGVEPCLAILRVGAREDDLAYERGALKRCEKVGVAVRQVVLPEDVTQKVLMENIHVEKGVVYVIPQCSYSATTLGVQGNAYPASVHIQTQWGTARYKIGERNTNPLDQWPDNFTYINYPSGQSQA